MYPLAQILHSQGYYLTGSDNNETETLEAVRKWESLFSSDKDLKILKARI